MCVTIGTFLVTLSDSLKSVFFSFQALQNDIGLRKKNVDQAISNGVELLKQTTGTSSFISVANSSVSVLLIIRFIALFIEQ